MRIVHVMSGRSRIDSANGVDKVVYHLSRSQAELGHDVSVFGVTDKPPLPIPGVGVDTFTPAKVPLHTPDGLVERIQTATPDVVHFHSIFVPSHTMTGQELRRHGIPYVVTPHGALNPMSLAKRRTRKMPYMRIFERRFLNGAQAIHAICDPEARDIRALGINVPIFVVPNGTDVSEIPGDLDPEFLTNLIPEARGKRVFLFLGRLAIEHKGLDLLVEAVKLAENDLQDAIFVIAGPDWRGNRAILEDQVKRAGLERFVVFPGPVYGSDRFNLIAGADVFAHTSRWDVMPTGVLEAMAVAKPCLVTTTTGLADLVVHRCAGVVTDPLADAISEALSTLNSYGPQTLTEMGGRAQIEVTNGLAWRNIAADWIEHYDAE